MPPTWFDEAQIERTVNRKFVCSHLTPEEIGNLDRPLLFGDGLTNDTYWEWIQTKARRLFLILLDLGVPDQIFGIIDDSWEDDDLPIPLDQVHRLALTEERDSRLERKFYDQQFTYLLRTMQRGQHIDYADQELVPLDAADRRPASSHQDVVELPNRPGQTFSRRGVQLGLHMSREDFMCEISLIRDIQNDHIESYFASYTHHNHAYVLFTPASEYKLSAYLANTPTSLKNVDKLAKRRLVLDWIHCLIDTLTFLHSNGEALGNIKPSTISFTHDHHVVLPDSTCFNPGTLEHHDTKAFSKEAYDYAAPEQCLRASAPPPSARTRTGAFPSAPDVKSRPTFAISRGAHMEPARRTQHQHQHQHHQHQPRPAAPRHNSAPDIDPQAADVFSLGCIILDLLSHGLLKRSSSAFATVRSAKHKIAGRGGAVLDSSFHKNLGQVEVWMNGLSKDAGKKADGRRSSGDKGRLFAAVTPLLHVVERMLAAQPGERPSAAQVHGWVHQIVTEVAGLQAPHCVHQHGRDGEAGVGGPGSSSSSSSSSNSARSPTFPEPLSPSFDRASVRQASSATTTLSKRGSTFSMRTLGHKRTESDESSSAGQASISTSLQEGDRWGLGSGWATSIQHLRRGPSKTRLWQTPSHAGSVASSAGT